jgi:hypothetical protein
VSSTPLLVHLTLYSRFDDTTIDLDSLISVSYTSDGSQIKC